MRALSIRQPFAELILRGIKTIEYRSRPTRIIGERFHIYASKGRGMRAEGRIGIKADNIVVPTQPPPPWMIELANALKLFPHELPTGVIVGSAVIEKVTQGDDFFEWHLKDIERTRPRKPARHPQPVWFKPF
jgi:hypothetical protein